MDRFQISMLRAEGGIMPTLIECGFDPLAADGKFLIEIDKDKDKWADIETDVFSLLFPSTDRHMLRCMLIQVWEKMKTMFDEYVDLGIPVEVDGLPMFFPYGSFRVKPDGTIYCKVTVYASAVDGDGDFVLTDIDI